MVDCEQGHDIPGNARRSESGKHYQQHEAQESSVAVSEQSVGACSSTDPQYARKIPGSRSGATGKIFDLVLAIRYGDAVDKAHDHGRGMIIRRTQTAAPSRDEQEAGHDSAHQADH